MITRRLACKLTEGDILDRGKQLANAEHDYRQVEAEKTEANRNFKSSLDAITGRIELLADAIRDKQEERDVPCIIEDDYAALRKHVIRTDTQEIVESYDFSQAEIEATRQGSLL